MNEGEQILEAIDRLLPAFEASGLDELELELGDVSVRLARPIVVDSAAASSAPPAGVVAPSTPTPAAPAPAREANPFGEPRPGMRFVTAPLTGVWYPSPSPGARPYVEDGAEITTGQVVGLIEAMKLFNEIKSDVSGIVARVIPERGTLVKRNQPLLEVDPR
jgi:acetyl-CoA carboxylase biotin carboxyl carrier protein